MFSRGSTIPLFIQQMKENKPLTITNPDMTRFMMTLYNAVDLVLYAFNNANPGDKFAQKASAAASGILIHTLKELYNSDSEIKFIGTRHGEKLYESLVNSADMLKAKDIDNYTRIPYLPTPATFLIMGLGFPKLNTSKQFSF